MGFYAVGVSVSGFSAHVQDLQINARSYSIKWICCRSIRVNNLSGPIPSFLGNITTLGYLYALIVSFFLTCHIDSKIMLCFQLSSGLSGFNIQEHYVFRSIDNNMFSGAIPHELGKLVNLKNLWAFFFFFLINV